MARRTWIQFIWSWLPSFPPAGLWCALSDHRLGPECPSACGQWAFRECSRCQRLVTTKRPPPIIVIHHFTVETEVVEMAVRVPETQENPEAGRRQSEPLEGSGR